MDEIERKVDLLISGIVLPQKRTRRRIATIVTTLLIATALITGASLIGYYVQITGDVTVENLLWLDNAPALDTPIIEISVNVVPGCTVTDGQHTIWLNQNYAEPTFTVYFHIETTEIDGDGEGLTIEIWDVTGTPDLIETVPPQIVLNPGESNARTFEIRVTADASIDSTSTYGYIITMDWKGTN